MKKILLAGGAGYIGTELCKRLQRLDYKVTVIDELWFGNNLNPKVELIQNTQGETLTNYYWFAKNIGLIKYINIALGQTYEHDIVTYTVN